MHLSLRANETISMTLVSINSYPSVTSAIPFVSLLIKKELTVLVYHYGVASSWVFPRGTTNTCCDKKNDCSKNIKNEYFEPIFFNLWRWRDKNFFNGLCHRNGFFEAAKNIEAIIWDKERWLWLEIERALARAERPGPNIAYHICLRLELAGFYRP